MMSLFISLIFMILIVPNWWSFSLGFLLIMMNLLFNNISTYPVMMSYNCGLDLVSYWLIILTLWIIFLMIMASFSISTSLFGLEFLITLLFLALFLVLAFSCTNLFMFYLWFESSMIPTLFLIFGWGYQPERLTAGFYLIFYTLFATLPMLICVFYLYSNSFTLFYFMINMNINVYIYICMIMAFLIKMPMFFVHFWLPKAHVEAPVSGSMILAGVLLKLGGYGLYRVMMFLQGFGFYNFIWIVISLFGSVVIGLLCLCQVDIKSLIAYSSVSHMGLVISGLMTLNSFGLWGSFVMMLGHGLCSSSMFAMANMSYERTHSRSIMINKGLLTFMPTMSMFWFLLSINNMSSPPSLNLLGEVMLINSLMSWSGLSFLFLALSSFLSCCYSVYLYSMTQHGSLFSGSKFESYGSMREYITIIFHWLPLNLLFLKSDVFSLWL